MFAAIIALALIAAVVTFLVREVRGGGYGRASLPSLAQVGAERTKVLRWLAT
jgi:hypothetical protein